MPPRKRPETEKSMVNVRNSQGNIANMVNSTRKHPPLKGPDGKPMHNTLNYYTALDLGRRDPRNQKGRPGGEPDRRKGDAVFTFDLHGPVRDQHQDPNLYLKKSEYKTTEKIRMTDRRIKGLRKAAV